MVNKIIFMLVFLSCLFSSAYAGMYAGVGVVRDTATFHKSLKIQDSQTRNTLYYKNDEQPGSGVLGNGFVGYGWQRNKFYLGTELNVAVSSLKYHGYFIDYQQNEKSEAQYRIDKSYGVSVLPGYKIVNDWMLYGRVGLARANFKYAEYKSEHSLPTRGVTEWRWLNGFRYGLGVSGLITKNAGIRLEYSRIQYQTYTNTSFPLAVGSSRIIRLTPATDQMGLEVFYKFD